MTEPVTLKTIPLFSLPLHGCLQKRSVSHAASEGHSLQPFEAAENIVLQTV